MKRTAIFEREGDKIVRFSIVERTDESRGRIIGHVPRPGCTCGGCWLLCERDDPNRETTIDDIPRWPS